MVALRWLRCCSSFVAATLALVGCGSSGSGKATAPAGGRQLLPCHEAGPVSDGDDWLLEAGVDSLVRRCQDKRCGLAPVDGALAEGAVLRTIRGTSRDVHPSSACDGPEPCVVMAISVRGEQWLECDAPRGSGGGRRKVLPLLVTWQIVKERKLEYASPLHVYGARSSSEGVDVDLIQVEEF